jgi:hypothetical protein
MITEADKLSLANNFSDPWFRINHLYHIIDKQGKKVQFKCNWAQAELFHGLHYLNLILKARQLGISTFIGIYLLDKCLIKDNVSAGIICHTREDAEHFFKRIKFAYDNLDEGLKSMVTAQVDSARELVLSNGSSIRVGTSMRSSTLNYLHVSEFGKICAHYPEKAREIMTGSLNTLAVGQHCFIESTAEGREGEFYKLCQEAQALSESKKVLSKLDYKFFFFPWWKDTSYSLEQIVSIPKEMSEYFQKLKELGIELTEAQKHWYVKKQTTQLDDMKREYPSTSLESFESAADGAYYSKQLSTTRLEGRITNVYYNDELPVHTAWDFGYADDTAIWLFQLDGQMINIIDYIEGSNEPLTHYLKLLKALPYLWGHHLVPHDGKNHEYSNGFTRLQVAGKSGFTFSVVEDISVDNGIDAARLMFKRCWFDEKRCAKGIAHLTNYKRAWNAAHGCWSSKPLHNTASHASDAFRYMAIGLSRVGQRGVTDQDYEQLRDRYNPTFS